MRILVETRKRNWALRHSGASWNEGLIAGATEINQNKTQFSLSFFFFFSWPVVYTNQFYYQLMLQQLFLKDHIVVVWPFPYPYQNADILPPHQKILRQNSNNNNHFKKKERRTGSSRIHKTATSPRCPQPPLWAAAPL
jgi:hypothetical protein